MRVVDGIATIDHIDAFVAQLDSIGTDHDTAVQAFDARYVASREHLSVAVERANRAFERDDTIATDRAVEILCYAAGRRQIERALEMGVGPGENPVVIVVDDGDEDGAASAATDCLEPAETLEGARDEDAIRAFFDITPTEEDATEATLADLVIERVSLLAIEK